MDLQEAWKNVLGELEVGLSRANFNTWFKDTFIDDYKNRKKVVIGVPTNFAKTWLEKKYEEELIKALNKNLPQVKEIEFVIKEKKEEEKEKEKNPQLVKSSMPKPKKMKEQGGKVGLNENYTFKNFIVGEANKLAHAASRAVAKQPGKSYNPLFLYGGVGLGKTHLLHAIGNRATNQYPDKKVVYAACESFTNHFINSVKNGKLNSFKNSYRKVDCLLVDDVQFITGKERTQEEFFHTFNALYQDQKQIVISSDRSPKDIPLLEDRLRSRFEAGMIADIGKPDFETRRAIIEQKLEKKDKELPEDIIEFIAEKIHHSVRELEGAINRLTAYADLKDQEITQELTENVLSSIMKNSKKRVDPEKVIKAVCSFYEVKKKQVLGKRRFKEIVLPRQLAMYLLRHELNLSYPQIASLLKRKDHTTIIHGCDKIEKKLQNEEGLKKEVEMLKEKLYLS